MEEQGALNQRACRRMDQVDLGLKVLSGWCTPTVQNDSVLLVKPTIAAPLTFDPFAWPTLDEIAALVTEKAHIQGRFDEVSADLRLMGLKSDAG